MSKTHLGLFTRLFPIVAGAAFGAGALAAGAWTLWHSGALRDPQLLDSFVHLLFQTHCSPSYFVLLSGQIGALCGLVPILAIDRATTPIQRAGRGMVALILGVVWLVLCSLNHAYAGLETIGDVWFVLRQYFSPLMRGIEPVPSDVALGGGVGVILAVACEGAQPSVALRLLRCAVVAFLLSLGIVAVDGRGGGAVAILALFAVSAALVRHLDACWKRRENVPSATTL